MKKVMNVALVLVAFCFTASASAGENGALLGAITGGVIGNQIGGGQGRVFATAFGALVGANVGSRMGDTIAYAPQQRGEVCINCGQQYQQPQNYGASIEEHRREAARQRGVLRAQQEAMRAYERRLQAEERAIEHEAYVEASGHGGYRTAGYRRGGIVFSQ